MTMKNIGNDIKTKDEGKQWFQVIAIVIGCLSSTTGGLLFAWSSPFIVKITKDKENYDISEDAASYFTVFPSVALLLTSTMFSHLSDYIGRKRTLLLVSIPHMLSWILSAVASNVYVFYAARICAGAGDGCVYATLPMYIGEVATPKVRGTWGISFIFSVYLGMFLMNVIGNTFSVQETSYICMTIPIMFVVLFSFMPESPYFYIMKERHQEAKESLRKLRRKKDVEKDFVSLKADVDRQLSESGTWKDLIMIKSNRKALYAGLFLRISQQLGGSSAFGVYTQYIFEKVGGNISSALSAIIYTGLYLILNIFAMFTIDRIGRKKSYFGSLIPCSLLLFIEATYFYIDEFVPQLDTSSLTWIPLAGMIVFIFFSSFGLAIIPTLMLGELFSASIKAKGLNVLCLALAIMQFLSNYLFFILSSNVGFYSPFLFFSICCFISIFLTLYLVPETKGKTLEEIQQSLKKGGK